MAKKTFVSWKFGKSEERHCRFHHEASELKKKEEGEKMEGIRRHRKRTGWHLT